MYLNNIYFLKFIFDINILKTLKKFNLKQREKIYF